MAAFYVEEYRAATIECVLQSAVNRNVPANVLLAIGQREAGKEGSAIPNKNGTYDLGRTGINTVHLVELEKAGVSRKKAAYYLMYDGCYSYDMAAFLLARHIAECRQDFWTCVANYHSKTESKNAIYKAFIIPLANQWEKYLSAHYKTRDYSKK